MATAPGTVPAICSPAPAHVSWNWRTLLWESRNRCNRRARLRSLLLIRLRRKIRIPCEAELLKALARGRRAIARIIDLASDGRPADSRKISWRPWADLRHDSYFSC